MTQSPNVTIREVIESDLPLLFEFQDDAGAAEMVGLPIRSQDDFDAHWRKIMANPENILYTILVDGVVVGGLSSFVAEGEREVGYQLGRAYWGRGIATRALELFLPIIQERPLFGVTTPHNIGSQKVLTRCGFVFEAEEKGQRKYKLI